MRAKALVTILAERFDIMFQTAEIIDRSLSTGDLRRQGSGRNWPMMTREEAITFMLACMVTERPTKAAEEVRPWLAMKAVVNVEPKLIKLLKGGHKKIVEPDDWEDETEFPELPKAVFSRSIEHYFKDKRDSDKTVGLGVYLRVICSLLSDGLMEPDKLRFVIVRSLGKAQLTYTNETGKVLLDDQFSVDAMQQRPSVLTKAGIAVSASVSGHAFNEIIMRTTDDTDVA